MKAMKKPLLRALPAVMLATALFFGCAAGSAASPGNAASAIADVAPAPAVLSLPPEPEPEPQELLVRFSAVGDNLVHDGLYIQAAQRAAAEGAEGYDFNYCFEAAAPFFRQFDVNWMNQETLLNDEFPPSGYPMFSTPAQMGEATRAAGWGVYSLSNNHSYDLGAAGIASTRRVWAATSAVTTGLYTSKMDDSAITLHEVNGITIAYLAYTDHTNGLPEPADAEAVVIYTSELDVMEWQVRRAAELADAVVVGVHWEVENSHIVTDAQRTLAANLADWGATVVIGTHPHVIQPVETVTGPATGRVVPVAYSLGNFISAQSQANQMIGYAFTFDLLQTVEPDETRHPVRVENVKAWPTVTHYGAGYSDVRTYMLGDYTEELAVQHGVRARYPNFSLAYIRELCQSYVSPDYLVL